MALAWIVTVLALGGAWAGVFLGHQIGAFSHRIAAAGGGLLFGISIFWLMPEIAETSGSLLSLVIPIAIAAVVAGLDLKLAHRSHSAQQGILWPLLLATAIHSLLDGWSVRLLSLQPLTNIAVTLGLALHKVPEGAAIGWISRRSLTKPVAAFGLCAATELFTLVGAWAEPPLNASGVARFGYWWGAAVLSIIAGGFLFLAIHSVAAVWKRYDVAAIFLSTALLVGALTLLHSPV